MGCENLQRQIFLSLFPPPTKLLFEEKMYKDFDINEKEIYKHTCNENGILLMKKMTIKRGVLLSKDGIIVYGRDLFYEKVVRSINGIKKNSKIF